MPTKRQLAHLSDLHLGRDRRGEENAVRVVSALRAEGVETLLVTGDVTHRGRASELALFETIFAPIRDRVVVVPGNHDRLGENAGRSLMPGVRVAIEARPGLHVVRLDSTAPHNRGLLSCHGQLTEEDVAEVDAAISAADPDTLVALMLHHHLLPLPADHLSERFASWLGLPNAAELPRGRRLLERLRGRCDLVVHGHRHAASALVLPARAGRTLHVMNAGSTTELARFAVLTHAGGRIESERWVDASARRLRTRLDASDARRREGGRLPAAPEHLGGRNRHPAASAPAPRGATIVGAGVSLPADTEVPCRS